MAAEAPLNLLFHTGSQNYRGISCRDTLQIYRPLMFPAARVETHCAVDPP